MSVSTEVLARKYLNPVAGTPISVDFPVFEDAHVRVFYGLAGLEATLDTDFTVALNVPTYEDFTVTPTASLRTKIDAMLAANPSESDQIVVRRDMPMLTDMTPTLSRLRDQLALEFDRTALRLQELQEQARGAVSVPVSEVDGLDMTLPPVITRGDKLMSFNFDGTPSVVAQEGILSTTLGGKALSFVRVNAAEDAYEFRTSTQARGDVDAERSHWVNALDYGMSPSLADNSAAFNAAAGAAAGGTLFIPKGTYAFTSRPNAFNCSVVGEGVSQTIFGRDYNAATATEPFL
jgi:hypothetical protein